jgi:hypothetical protein
MGDGSSGARRTAKAAQIIRTVDPGAAARAWAKQTQPSGPPNMSLEAFAALQGCPRLRATGHSADPHGRRAAVHSRAVVQASASRPRPTLFQVRMLSPHVMFPALPSSGTEAVRRQALCFGSGWAVVRTESTIHSR